VWHRLRRLEVRGYEESIEESIVESIAESIEDSKVPRRSNRLDCCSDVS
jgi:hypothetical protein